MFENPYEPPQAESNSPTDYRRALLRAVHVGVTVVVLFAPLLIAIIMFMAFVSYGR